MLIAWWIVLARIFWPEQTCKIEVVLWQPLITKTNSSITSKSLSRVSSGNHKRTWQEVPNVLLPYLYYRYMVYANNK